MFVKTSSQGLTGRRIASAAVAGCLSLANAGAALADACQFAVAFERPDEGGSESVTVYEGRSETGLGGVRPLAYVTSLKVNTDGTRISYHRDDPRAKSLAINDVRNAMRSGKTIADFEAIAAANWPLPKTWTVLLDNVIEKDKDTGKPCVTEDGYLISMTADVAVPGGFNNVGDCDPAKWIDALTIPAIVLPSPSQFKNRGAVPRSLVVVASLTEPRRVVFGIVGDSGPADEIGEASVEMNRMLNDLPDGERPANYEDAKERFQGPRSVVLLFLGSENRLARPITPERVEAAGHQAFEAWGGEARLDECLPEIPEATQ